MTIRVMCIQCDLFSFERITANANIFEIVFLQMPKLIGIIQMENYGTNGFIIVVFIKCIDNIILMLWRAIEQ